MKSSSHKKAKYISGTFKHINKKIKKLTTPDLRKEKKSNNYYSTQKKIISVLSLKNKFQPTRQFIDVSQNMT